MKKLTFEDYIPLSSIEEWGYIPEFKRYGPCGRLMVKVGDLINALNRRVKLTIPEKFIGPIYVLIKEYNMNVEQDKSSGLKEASIAEHELDLILYKEECRVEKEEQLANPIDDSTTQEEMEEIQRIMISRPIVIQKKKAKSSKPKVYEVVAAKKINTYEELVPRSQKTKYDDIEFITD